MAKGRLEAFSDGVIAIIITIMVLELRIPRGGSVQALGPLLPVFLSYVLSFVYVGIYWNNHHHMLHACTGVTGVMLWANLHLLFCLSLFPFATGWMGQNNFAAVPTALYGIVLLMAAIADLLLQRAIIRAQGHDSLLKKAIGSDWKSKVPTRRRNIRRRCTALVDSGPAHRKTSLRIIPESLRRSPPGEVVCRRVSARGRFCIISLG